MKRRMNGDGCIRKRTDHSWEGSLRTEDDSRIYIYGNSQKEVKSKLKEIQAEIDSGSYIPENEMTVGEWMDEWFECFTSGVKASSRERYEQDIRIHIKPGIGQINLQDLNLAQKTVKNIYLVLNKA